MKAIDQKTLQEVLRRVKDSGDGRKVVLLTHEVITRFPQIFAHQDLTTSQQIANELDQITKDALPNYAWLVRGRSIFLVNAGKKFSDDSPLSYAQEERIINVLRRAGIAGEGESLSRAPRRAQTRLMYGFGRLNHSGQLRFKITTHGGLEGKIADLAWLRNNRDNLKKKFGKAMAKPFSESMSIFTISKDAPEVNASQLTFLQEELFHFDSFFQVNQNTYSVQRTDHCYHATKNGEAAFTLTPQKCQIHAVEDDEVIKDSIALFIRTNGPNLTITNSTEEFDRKLSRIISNLRAQGELVDHNGQQAPTVTVNKAPIEETGAAKVSRVAPHAPAP